MKEIQKAIKHFECVRDGLSLFWIVDLVQNQTRVIQCIKIENYMLNLQ